MTDLAGSPRLLLRRLHQLMAGPGSAEQRLSQLTTVIAQNMVAEVCSVYLVRAGEILELFATEGLRPEAVHNTRLRFGEGLVGLVAQRGLPLNVQEASSHPRFAYRPETGEEHYHSFLGVPIIRSGKVVGVLVVQNVLPREYSAEEEEALLTIAMVLAELVGSGELVSSEEMVEALTQTGMPLTLTGQKMADGIGMGSAVFHEGKIEVTRFVAEDIDYEKQRLLDAFAAMREAIDRMITAPEIGTAGEHRDILETFKMFAYDRGWQARIHESIEAGLTAEAAVERVQQQNRRRMIASPDPYLRERLSDLEDLTNRLLRVLSGRKDGQMLTVPAIIVGRSMGPAELLDYDRRFIKGVVLEEGSTTSHVSILARAMGIPLVGRVKSVREHIEPGDMLIVDGDNGEIVARPSDEIADSFARNIALRAERAEQYLAERNLPAITRDGVHIRLFMNAGLLADMGHVEASGADGVGLFRTEFQFMVSSTLPRLEVQRDFYAKVIESAGERPVIFRTLDIGGDKAVPFLPREDEENPAMGWRAIRIALDRPVLLRYQIRALLKAASGRALGVMFPMVSEISEFRAAKAIVDKECLRLSRLDEEGPSSLAIGVMLEVPSLAWQLDPLLREVDFLSIGTNDLLQFFFAADRSNPKLSDRYDLLSPAVLNFLRMVVKACDRACVPVNLCGEMGGRTLEAMALIGLGLRRLSVSPTAIGPLRRMVRSLDIKRLEDFVLGRLDVADHSLRSALRDYARDHGIVL